MRDLALDINNDLAFDGSDLAIIDGAASLVQRVKVALSVHTGEWFLDIRAGVPWLSLVFVRNPNLPVVDSVLRARIASVPEVARIESYQSTYDPARRRLDVTFRVIRIDGTTDGGTLTLDGDGDVLGIFGGA